MIKIEARLGKIEITKPAKAGFFYVATNFLAKAIALFTTPIFTRLLSPDEYGVFSLYTTWIGILSVVLSLGISVGTLYRGLGKFKDRESDFISATLGLLSVFSLVLLILSVFLAGRLSSMTGLATHLNFLLLGEVFLNVGQVVFFALFRYKYAFGRVSIINILYALLTPIIALTLIYFTPLRAEARIYASFGVMAFLNLPSIIKLINPKKIISWEIWKYLFKLSLPYLPSAISMTLIAQSDKIMIERYLGANSLGKYSIAYSVGFILTTLTGAAYTALQPWLMRKLNTGLAEKAKRLAETIIFLSSLGLVLFLLFVPEIFKIIAGPEYQEAEIAVYPLAIAGFLQFISNIISANIIHSEKTFTLSFSAGLAFLFNLISNIMLIPKYGYTAAAFTTAAAYGILILAQYFFLKRLKCPKIVDKKSFLPLSVTIFAIPIYSLKEVFVSRLIFSAVIILFAVPKLIDLFKQISERKQTAN